jgi:predicted transglutaminase-like protease
LAESYEFLFRVMEENWLLARQAEDKRAIIALVNLIVASAANAVLLFTGFNLKVLPLTIWMVVLGVYGITTSRKLYERSQYHFLRARKLRVHLDGIFPNAQVEQLLKQAESEHKIHYAFLMNVRLNNIWILLHIAIAISGLLYTFISLAVLSPL